MADLVTGNNSWRTAVDEELRQLIDDMLQTEKTHLAAAERLQKLHRRVDLLATMLAVLGCATVLSNHSKLAAGLLALGAAVASGVLTFMQPDKAAAQHLATGRELAALRVRARQTLNLDLHRLTEDELRSVMEAIAGDKAKIDAAAPGTEAGDYKRARSRITAGTFDRDR